MVYIATWVIIFYLPPIRGTRKLQWKKVRLNVWKSERVEVWICYCILWPTQHINEDLALNIRTGFDKALVDAAGGESFAKPVIFLFALQYPSWEWSHIPWKVNFEDDVPNFPCGGICVARSLEGNMPTTVCFYAELFVIKTPLGFL